MKMIKVADRYPCPGPRYKKLGSASGEDFRDWIEQELASNEGLVIDLDGTEGYGSSFLEESFGGLIRKGYDIDVIRGIKLKSDEEPELIDEIKEYIEDAIKYSHEQH
ncbi:DUF4325 domain-containing protein [Pantoea sp. FDAARGOS_194]|uniref:STAS-like domain-containing protein n=1 Tax=Pantoea TaxID=53335 RepID=UPI000BB55A80|nr:MULTISPECIES: STAS-like domain-containing protein [Pantoea]PNK65214.1 DUF4325 domain-containing protein [Pantoea sp. FDAARGOS_194]